MSAQQQIETAERFKAQHFALSDTQRNKVFGIAANHNIGNFYSQANELMPQIGAAIAQVLPNEITETIIKMGQGLGPDLIFVSNLPIDPVLPQDTDLEERVYRKSKITESCLIGLSSFLNGHLQTEESSHQTGLIQQIAPVNSFEAEASGRGSAELPFHVENVFTKAPPSFLCLFCLQGESGVATEYLPIQDVVKYLDQLTIKKLSEPLYTIVSGDGFSRKELTNSPVIEDMGNQWSLCRFYQEDRIFSDDTEARIAIEKLHHAIDRACENDIKSLELSAGTLLIFANGASKFNYGGVMHGRKGKIGQANNSMAQNAASRWLHRICVEIDYT